MYSNSTPHTHTGVTAEAFTTTVGPSRSEVVVPAGVRCHKLNGGSSPWVVDDLDFISDKKSILYWDADHYGIRVPEDKVKDVRQVR